MIYQSLSNTKYVTEIMHIVTCFKKLWKSNLKQAWLDYCLINPSKRADKFMANDRFGKKIILLNKKMICPSVNVLSDEFLRETVIMNMIFFWKCQEAISRTIRTTLHGNCHSFAAKLPNILLLVKNMTKNSLFCEQLGQKRLQSNFQQLTFLDLFADGTACLAISLKLGKYICATRGN